MKKYTLVELTKLFEQSKDHRLIIDQLAKDTFSMYTAIEVLDIHEDAVYILIDDESFLMGWYGPDSGINSWFKIRDNIYKALDLLVCRYSDDDELVDYTFKGYTQTDLTMSVSEFITKVDSDEIILVRPLLGTLNHALNKSSAVVGIEGVRRYIGEHYVMCDLSHPLRIEKYGRFDTRCGWDTHLVFLNDSPMLYISGSVGE